MLLKLINQLLFYKTHSQIWCQNNWKRICKTLLPLKTTDEQTERNIFDYVTIYSLNDKSLKLIDKLIYLDSNISSTDIQNMNNEATDHFWQVKEHIKIKWDLFQAVIVSEVLGACTIYILT